MEDAIKKDLKVGDYLYTPSHVSRSRITGETDKQWELDAGLSVWKDSLKIVGSSIAWFGPTRYEQETDRIKKEYELYMLQLDYLHVLQKLRAGYYTENDIGFMQSVIDLAESKGYHLL